MPNNIVEVAADLNQATPSLILRGIYEAGVYQVKDTYLVVERSKLYSYAVILAWGKL